MADSAIASGPARDTAAEHMFTGISRARIDTTIDQGIDALRGMFCECADSPMTSYSSQNSLSRAGTVSFSNLCRH